MRKGVVVIDTNLLVLLAVGGTSTEYIGMHRRLRDYDPVDFAVLEWLIDQFSELVLLPHILAEASNLTRQISNPVKGKIQGTLRALIDSTLELPVASQFGAARPEFLGLGLTDATILHLCTMEIEGIMPTLITVDTDLANAAHSLGYSVVDYKEWQAPLKVEFLLTLR